MVQLEQHFHRAHHVAVGLAVLVPVAARHVVATVGVEQSLDPEARLTVEDQLVLAIRHEMRGADRARGIQRGAQLAAELHVPPMQDEVLVEDGHAHVLLVHGDDRLRIVLALELDLGVLVTPVLLERHALEPRTEWPVDAEKAPRHQRPPGLADHFLLQKLPLLFGERIFAGHVVSSSWCRDDNGRQVISGAAASRA